MSRIERLKQYAETFTFLAAAAAANALPDGHLPGLGRPPVSLDFAGCHVPVSPRHRTARQRGKRA